MEAAFKRGLEAIRAEHYFEAHEELEMAWRAAATEERDFFQGLVHVAVAWYQAGRGNRYGCERQLAKAARRLARFTPERRGVDVAGVLAQVADAQARVAAGFDHVVAKSALEERAPELVEELSASLE